MDKDKEGSFDALVEKMQDLGDPTRRINNAKSRVVTVHRETFIPPQPQRPDFDTREEYEAYLEERSHAFYLKGLEIDRQRAELKARQEREAREARGEGSDDSQGEEGEAEAATEVGKVGRGHHISPTRGGPPDTIGPWTQFPPGAEVDEFVEMPTYSVDHYIYRRYALYWCDYVYRAAVLEVDKHASAAWTIRVAPYVTAQRGSDRPRYVKEPESFAVERMLDGMGDHLDRCGFCTIDFPAWTRVLEVLAKPLPGVPRSQLRRKGYTCTVCDRSFGHGGLGHHQKSSGHRGFEKRVS